MDAELSEVLKKMKAAGTTRTLKNQRDVQK